MTIEITKEAAQKLIGNDEETWRDYKQDELAETSFYYGYGVHIQVIHKVSIIFNFILKIFII